MDPQILTDLLDTFGADGAQVRLPWNVEGDVAALGYFNNGGFGEGLRFEANGREWRVLQVGVADDDMNQLSYRSDSQLRDAARVLPPVCFAPLVLQYTQLLRDPRWAVMEVPRIMSAMLHDPALFHVMDANPLAPLSEYRVAAMTRWWAVQAKPALRYDNNNGRPLMALICEGGNDDDDGSADYAAAATATAFDEGAAPHNDAEDGGNEERQDGGLHRVADTHDSHDTTHPHNTRMPLPELRQRYRDIKTVLTLIAATSAPYRCSRPPNAAVSGCTARLVFCKDPSTIYLGLLLNTVLRELPRKVLCSMPVFRLIAEGWGNSPSLQEILQATWEEYQDVLQEICALLEANAAAVEADSGATVHTASPSGTTVARARPLVRPQRRPRRTLPHLRFPSQPHEDLDSAQASASASAAAASSFGSAGAPTVESMHSVEFGIPLGRERMSVVRLGPASTAALSAQIRDGFIQRFGEAEHRLAGGTADGSYYADRNPPSPPAVSSSGAGDRSRQPRDGATTSAGAAAAAADDSNATYRTEDAGRICLESMRECAQSPELLLWWARCRLLAYQLLDSSSRVGVESTRALDYFRQLWACAPLAREILEDDREALLAATIHVNATTTTASSHVAEAEAQPDVAGRTSPPSATAAAAAASQRRLAGLQRRARRLYASLVGTIADLSKFWFSVRVAQSTLNAVASSAPENNIIWSLVNATVPSRRRFQREEFTSYAEHWQYALLVDDYVTQPMGFRVSTRGRTMVTQLLHVLHEYPTFYPALVTRTLAMLNRREMIVADLNGRLVSAVARCLRFYLPPMPPVLAVAPVTDQRPASAAAAAAAAETTATAVDAPSENAPTAAPVHHRRASTDSSFSSSSISLSYSPPSGHLRADDDPASSGAAQPNTRQDAEDEAEESTRRQQPATTTSAAAAEEARAEGGNSSTSGLNYEAYVMSDTDDNDDDDAHDAGEGNTLMESNARRGDDNVRRTVRDAAMQLKTEEEAEAKAKVAEEGNSEELLLYPLQHRRTARRAAAARCEAQRLQQEAAMPVLTTKAYDAVLTCLDVLRMLVRNAHLSVNPMGLLFTAPESITAAAVAATTAASPTSDPDASPISVAAAAASSSSSAYAPQAGEEDIIPPNGAAESCALAAAGDASPRSHRGRADRRHERRLEPARPKVQCDLYTLLHQLVYQTRYGPLAAAALRLFSACVHYNVRDMVPLFTERGLLNTVLAIARRPRPSSSPMLRHPREGSGGQRGRRHHRCRRSSVGTADPSTDAATPPLLFALDMLEETGLPNVPSRDRSGLSPALLQPFSPSSSSAASGSAAVASAGASPLVTTHPSPAILARYIPHEDPYLNHASVRMVLPEFVEAMTVHQATHAVFRRHQRWVSTLLEGLTVTPALPTTTLLDIRALWEDEERRGLAEPTENSESAAAAVKAEATDDDDDDGGGITTETSDAAKESRRLHAQLECRSSPIYQRLLRGLLASRDAGRAASWQTTTQGTHPQANREGADCSTAAVPPAATATTTTTVMAATKTTTTAPAPVIAQSVDASLVRLVELCRLRLKREEVGYKMLQGSVKDMSRVVTEMLHSSNILTSTFSPAMHHELTQLSESVRQFTHAVLNGATQARPFAPSTYSNAAVTPTFSEGSSHASSLQEGAVAPAPTSPAEEKGKHRRPFPASREDYFELLVRAAELCRSFNNFFTFFSAMDWIGQRRGPRLARNNAERQEGMEALRDILHGTVDKFHRTIQQLWSLMGCQVPLRVCGTPLSIAEHGIAAGESPLLSYVQVIIGQSLHPRILSDYLRNTQPSRTLEAVLRSTVRCILHYSTRSLFYLRCPASEADAGSPKGNSKTKATTTTTASAAGSEENLLLTSLTALAAEDRKEGAVSDQRYRQDELRRLLQASATAAAQSEVAAAPPAASHAGDGETTAHQRRQTEADASSADRAPPTTTTTTARPTAFRTSVTTVDAATAAAVREALQREPLLLENTGYPCYDCVSNVLRPLSLGDGIFLRQLLEVWRVTTASNSSSSSGSGGNTFAGVVAGPNRRDADGAAWRGVFGHVLRCVVDATVVRAAFRCEDVPSLLRSLRGGCSSSGGGLHDGLGNAVLSLYDRSAEAGAALCDAGSEGNTAANSNSSPSTGAHANPSDQLMQSLLQDSHNYVREPATAWMTAEAWREATTGCPASPTFTTAEEAPTVPGAATAAFAGTASSPSAAPTATAPSPVSPPAVQTPRSLAAPISGLEDVMVRVEGEDTLHVNSPGSVDSSASSLSSALTPTLQTTSASVPAHPTLGAGGVDGVTRDGSTIAVAAAVTEAANASVAPPAASAATVPVASPLFVPSNPVKAVQQWIFMTLFHGRRSSVVQSMNGFSHISAFRRDSRTRAMLPLNVTALVRTVHADLTTAFEEALRGVYADALTREQCRKRSAATRDREPENYTRAVDDVVAIRRHRRTALRARREADDGRANVPAEQTLQPSVCPWLTAKPRELVLMRLPIITNVDVCLPDINLAAAHRVLWELAVLDAVCAGGSTGGGGSFQEMDSKELVKTLTYAAQLLILLSRLFLSPGTTTTYERPRSAALTAAEQAKLDEAAAAASRDVVAAQGELRRCLVYMGVLMMNFLEGCDSRARGQHHVVVESLLYCVLDVWPRLPGFPMLPHLYTTAVDLMSQLKTDTFGNVRLHTLIEAPATTDRCDQAIQRTGANEEGKLQGGGGKREGEGEDSSSSSSDEGQALVDLFGNLSGAEEDAERGTGNTGPRRNTTTTDTATPGSQLPWPPLCFSQLLNLREDSDDHARDDHARDDRVSGSEEASLVEQDADGNWRPRRRFINLSEPYGAAFQRDGGRARGTTTTTTTDTQNTNHRDSDTNNHRYNSSDHGHDTYRSYHTTPATTRAERGYAALPTVHLWERMLPWLCDIVTGTVFPLNSLSEAGQRMLRRRACKVFWSLWTMTKSLEQPYVLAYMLHRVLSDARHNVVLLEYMGVLLSQLRGVVAVEALALTPLPRVIVAVVKTAIAAVAAEQAAWESEAVTAKAQLDTDAATNTTTTTTASAVDARRALREHRRRRRRAFAAEQETLHGQLVGFLTVFQDCRSDAPLVRDRFKRTSTTPHNAQSIGTQCNYFDATRNTFCWHGHQCHRHHVVPVNGQHGRDGEDHRFPLGMFGTGTQRVVDELLTVLENHGYESAPLLKEGKTDTAAKASSSTAAAARGANAARAEEQAHDVDAATGPAATTADRYPSPNSSEEGSSARQRASADNFAAFPTSALRGGSSSPLNHPSHLEAPMADAEGQTSEAVAAVTGATAPTSAAPAHTTATPNRNTQTTNEGVDNSSSSSPAATSLVRHERVTPYGFVSMMEGAAQQAEGHLHRSGSGATAAAVHSERPPSRSGSRQRRSSPHALATASAGEAEAEADDGAPHPSGSWLRLRQLRRQQWQLADLQRDINNSQRHMAELQRLTDAIANARAAAAAVADAMEGFPQANAWGGVAAGSEPNVGGAAAAAYAPSSPELGPVRHQLRNPLDTRRHHVDPLRRAIIPYFALFSRELCEEVLRLCLDFMAARLRDQAMERAETAEEEAEANAQMQRRTNVDCASSTSALDQAVIVDFVHEGGATAPQGSSSAVASPVLSPPPPPSEPVDLPAATAIAAPAPSSSSAAAAAAVAAPSATATRNSSTAGAAATAVSAAAQLAARTKLSPVEVTECAVSEVMVHFLLTCFFTYYRDCLRLVQTYLPLGGAMPAAGRQERTRDMETQNAMASGVSGPAALSVLCAYITSVNLPNREKSIILCELLLTDMPRVEEDIWRDMTRVLATAARLQHKAQRLTDKSFAALSAFHERRIHALTAAEARSAPVAGVAASTSVTATATASASTGATAPGHRKAGHARDAAQHQRRTTTTTTAATAAAAPAAAAAAATQSGSSQTSSGSPATRLVAPVPAASDAAHVSTKAREGDNGEKAKQTALQPAEEEEEDVRELHRYVVPAGIFLANLEPYIVRHPIAFYHTLQRCCEVRWVQGRAGDVPAAWLGVWVQQQRQNGPTPAATAATAASSAVEGKAGTTAVSEAHMSRSARAARRRARAAAAAAAATVTSPLVSAVASPATAAEPSREFVERVSCFMQHLARNVEAGLGRASHGVEVLAAVEQLPGVCAALLSLTTSIPVPRIYASILTTADTRGVLQEQRNEEEEDEEVQDVAAAAPALIPVPPFLALALYFCGTLSEADRSNPFDFAAGIDFAAGLLAFNPVVVADAVMQTIQRLVSALELLHERRSADDRHNLNEDEKHDEAALREQQSSGWTATSAATAPNRGAAAAREQPPEQQSARKRSLTRCLHDLLCFLECGSPRPAMAVLPSRQRAAQQLSGGNVVQEAFLRFHKHLANRGLLQLLFRVCRLRTCQHGRDATSLLQLLHHQLLTFGEYKLATMLSPGQKSYAAEQQVEAQERQRLSGVTNTTASLWPPLLLPRSRVMSEMSGGGASGAAAVLTGRDLLRQQLANPLDTHLNALRPLQTLFSNIAERLNGAGVADAGTAPEEEAEDEEDDDAVVGEEDADVVSYNSEANFPGYSFYDARADPAVDGGGGGDDDEANAGEEAGETEGDEIWEPMRPVRRRHHLHHHRHRRLPTQAHVTEAQGDDALHESEEGTGERHNTGTVAAAGTSDASSGEGHQQQQQQHAMTTATAASPNHAANGGHSSEDDDHHHDHTSSSNSDDDAYYTNEWEDYTSSDDDAAAADSSPDRPRNHHTATANADSDDENDENENEEEIGRAHV